MTAIIFGILKKIIFFSFNGQLYIKARGLDHLRFGHIVDTENGIQINLSELRKILSALKMPTVKKSPVHLEIVVQIEGKTIFFLFLNQKSYNTLTEGDSEYRFRECEMSKVLEFSKKYHFFFFEFY